MATLASGCWKGQLIFKMNFNVLEHLTLTSLRVCTGVCVHTQIVEDFASGYHRGHWIKAIRISSSCPSVLSEKRL